MKNEIQVSESNVTMPDKKSTVVVLSWVQVVPF
jgi:hypothetical protein